MEGIVSKLFINNLGKLIETPELELDLVGIEEDVNCGYTKMAGIEDAHIIGSDRLPVGTRIRNWRQWTAASKEDWDRVKNEIELGLVIRENRTGVNLVIEGIANFSRLPRGTILRFEEVALQVEVNNFALMDHVNKLNGDEISLSGLAGVVFRGGDVKIGERVVII